MLVVNDTPANLAAGRSILELCGYELMSATGATNAASIAAQKRPDLVLCHLYIRRLPSGSWRFAETDEVFKGVPVIIITSTQSGEAERHVCLEKMRRISSSGRPIGSAADRNR
jgi:CheY-like chemotaxis protein